jgi:hypothetical protein
MKECELIISYKLQVINYKLLNHANYRFVTIRHLRYQLCLKINLLQETNSRKFSVYSGPIIDSKNL